MSIDNAKATVRIPWNELLYFLDLPKIMSCVH
jgi:hypothetical protein